MRGFDEGAVAQIGHGLPDNKDAWKGSTKATAGTVSETDFWVPKGANRFHFVGGSRFVHGGVIGYAADNALTYAGGTALLVPVVTSEFKINHLCPAIGERLIARAQAVHTGKSQAVCRCDVFVVQNGQEKLCAVAQGTIASLPPTQVA